MAEAGHNSKLTEAEHQALWGHHVSKKLAHRRLTEEHKAAGKKLDADAKNDGFSKAELDDYLDCMTTDDPQKKVDKFNMLKRNRIRLGLIADDRKGDLLADRVTSEQMIFAAGVEAGLAAIDRHSKYPDPSTENTAWLSGYDDGQRIMRENLQSAMEKKNARRTNEEAPPPGDGDPFQTDEA